MSNINGYVLEYGNKTFDEVPFNEVDALVFSQLAYVNFSGLVCRFEDEIKIPLKEVSDQFFKLYSEEYLTSLVSISYKASMLLKLCADTKRFGNIKLLKFVNNVNRKIDKQFSAITFYIDDKTAVIAFRGTDTTITGIKESAMLAYMFPVPAQIESLYYFQESALISNRNVIICGHSKGGNLATFAGINCSNSIKRRLLGIYEFDAPGFPIELINRYDYLQIKDKIYSYIPQTSIIGRMLYHDSSLKIVSSNNENLKQHQVSSWEIEGNSFVFKEHTDMLSNLVDKFLKQFSEEVGEDNIEDVFETVFDILEDSDIDDFDDFKKFDIKKLFKALDSLKSIDDAQTQLIKDIFRNGIVEFSRLMYQERITNRLQALMDYTNNNTEE